MPAPLVRLPSLDLIKGFVAVGRRMSITQAADDLCVTQSAMSKQIRTLEDQLGKRLLHRGYRSVSFTEEGERLFRIANASVQQLQDAVGWLQWSDWLAVRGWTTAQAKGVIRFNQYDQAIHAAVAGQGIALGRLELLGPMLEDGRLRIVSPEREPGRSHFGYWLVQAEAHPRAEVAHVAQWILDAQSHESAQRAEGTQVA